MKPLIASLGTLGFLSSIVIAGTVVTDTANPAPVASGDGFAQARRPISNPTLFDLALPGTNVHPIFIHHNLPEQVNTTLGDVALGGDVQVYALQFEIALNGRLSIVAVKDGYVDMNPDSTLGNSDGWANLGAGLKYAFVLDPASGTCVSGTATFELPLGDDDVFQGEGDGAVNLILNGLKLVDQWQFAGAVGAHVPFSHEQSASSFVSAHASYEICKWFIPLAELNWFHVWDAGDGGTLYPPVSGIAEFEGNDFFNLGAANAHQNRDLVTAAIGFRSRITDAVDIGAAYEIPLTDDENSLYDDRFTVALIWRF
jgi:hypothetical protein